MKSFLPRLVSILMGCVMVLMLTSSAMAHQGHTNRAPWDACASQKLNDSCQWEDKAHARYIGSCRNVGQSLMCVRNQPIQQASVEAPRQQKSSDGPLQWLVGVIAVGMGLVLGVGFFKF